MALTYGSVVGRFTAVVGDTPDTGGEPDLRPVEGTVTFTPEASSLLGAQATPPTTYMPFPIVCGLDQDGFVSYPATGGTPGVQLLAAGGDTNPPDFTYRVSFNLSLDGQAIPYPSFSISVLGGQTVDLTTVAPVPSSGGTGIVKGDSWVEVLTQAEYDALTPDPEKLYVIAG